MRPGNRKALNKGINEEYLQEDLEKVKAKIRAKVEHPFHVVKNLFKHKKARYKGLEKNGKQLQTLFALANLMICKRQLKAMLEMSALGLSSSKMLKLG